MRITPHAGMFLLLAVMAGQPARGSVIFTLDPVGGALSGAPGDTIGWGFTLFNDSGYAVVTSSDYVTGTPVGTYHDYISSVQFSVIGVSPETNTWTQAFNQSLQTGVGQYFIDPGALAGARSDGFVQLTYDLYSVTPNDSAFDPSADLLSSGNLISAIASIDVTEPAQPSVPEPALGWLATLAGLAICARRRLSLAGR